MPQRASWTTLHMEVTTPLFNGGADPDGEAGYRADAEDGVRPASLRGAMRFWLRALAGIVAGPDLSLLADIERTVFGDTEQASPIRLRVPRQPAVTSPEEDHDFLHERRRYEGRWIAYLLGQGLWDMKNRTVKRPYVRPRQDFDLKLGFGQAPGGGDATAALALASLWLACAYGGIGGRIRRGFGGVRIAGADGWLPAPWDATSIRTPDLGHYEQGLPHGRPSDNLRRLWPTGAAGDCISHLRQLVEPGRFEMAQWPEPPPYPVLSRTHTLAGTSGGSFDSWAAAAAYAGEQLRLFRASKDYPAAPYRPKIKTPEWDDVVHAPHGPGAQTRFALGALGLPVVYKGNYTVNADLNADRGLATPLRRASPLWLRPVGHGGQWRMLSFAFCGRFLSGPDSPGVYLHNPGGQPRRLSVLDDDVVSLSRQWITKLAAGEWFQPGDRQPAQTGH